MNIILSISKKEINAGISSDKIMEYASLGVNGYRINLSKVTDLEIDDYIHKIEKIISLDILKGTNIILDLPYPKKKVRILEFENFATNNILQANEKLIISDKYFEYNDNCAHAIIEKYNKNLLNDNVVYYGDGLGTLECIERNEKFAVFNAINSFEIHTNKSLSFNPYHNNNCKLIYDACKYLLQYNKHIDFCLSFSENIVEINEFIHNVGCNKENVICKIETQTGIDNLTDLLNCSKGVLLGRGDLYYYSNICNFFENCNCVFEKTQGLNKEFYLCTDVLISLENRNIPNRAELTDVSYYMSKGCKNFILSGAFSFNDNIKNAITILNSI